MRVFILLILALMFCGPAQAYDVLIVQSQRASSYDEAVRGFRTVCQAPYSILMLSDYAEVDLARVVREDRPRLVVAVGDKALSAARKLRQVPVVAFLAADLPGATTRSNLTGVSMFPSPEQFNAVFSSLHAQRVGVVHSMDKTGWYVKRMAASARAKGTEVLSREVLSPRSTLDQLLALKGRIDTLLMIPDTTAVTNETVETFLHFSHEQMIPLVTFSTRHLDLGAAVAVQVDRQDIGHQAGEMAVAILNGASPSDLPIAAPRKVNIRKNDSVLKRLKISGMVSFLNSTGAPASAFSEYPLP